VSYYLAVETITDIFQYGRATNHEGWDIKLNFEYNIQLQEMLQVCCPFTSAVQRIANPGCLSN